MALGVPETVSGLRRPCASPEFSGSLPEGTEPIELLNENAMGPVCYIHKSGTGRQSICHNGLLIDVVLRLIAHQDSTFGRSWIYIIQCPSVCAGGSLAGWQR